MATKKMSYMLGRMNVACLVEKAGVRHLGAGIRVVGQGHQGHKGMGKAGREAMHSNPCHAMSGPACLSFQRLGMMEGRTQNGYEVYSPPENHMLQKREN